MYPTNQGKRETPGRLVLGWRNYHQYCNMGKHSLWFISHWLWKKLRKDKAKTKQKETLKLLNKKKAETQAHRKASELKSLESFNDSTNVSQTPKVKGAAKRILTNAQIDIAFPKVEWKVNKHVMVKGNASPYDGNLVYWVNRKSKLYANSLTESAMTRQKMKCAHCNHPFMPDDTVELHHVDGNHNN